MQNIFEYTGCPKLQCPKILIYFPFLIEQIMILQKKQKFLQNKQKCAILYAIYTTANNISG